MLRIEATVAGKIGFASHQNAVPVLRELRIYASSEGTPAEELSLRLTSDPPFLVPKTWLIDRLSPGDELEVSDRRVELNAEFLCDLTERMVGTLIFELIASDGAQLARSVHPVELLAHNEWGGLGSMAELLPAFVMPNDPAVDRVVKAASEVLRRAGKPHNIDGYQAGSRERVWEIVSAVWSAITGLRLSYTLPPASFETAGQKIRTPGSVLDGGVATCLDTAVLFAAVLEQAGLNPLIVFTTGHAFVGVWLQPVEFSSLLTDEAAAIRRRFDIDDLLLFETTLATNDPPAKLSEAVAYARRQVGENAESSFQMAIDIRRARIQKICPLGVAVKHPTGSEGAASVIDGLEASPSLPAFDVNVEQTADTAVDRIRQWQRKLLNLTTSNRLLHLPETAKAARLLCPDPAALEDLLASGRKVRIAPMPDLTASGRDEALYQQQTQASLRDEVAKAAMARGEALSPLTKEKLEPLLIDLYRKAKTDIEEGGANTLYLALGFLKWKKSPTEERTYRAPLILLPVRLDRKSAMSGVTISVHEDEPRFNLTLLELLRQDFELTIPGLDGELPQDSSGIDVAGIWRTVRAAVRDMVGFEVVTDVAIGTFSFAKYLMWKDLVDRADRLKDSPLVRHLIERDGASYGERSAFPRPEELDVIVDPAALFTPLPADSSQLTAVVASAQGRDFVLDGPPGTGKSQTIANMIAHNMALGRRVLFVAEKKAALDVVQRRLADKGLAPFCLELHSAKATKAQVLRQLDSAWTTRDALSAEEWAREADEARRLRDELNEMVRLLHRREPSGWTLHRAMGRVIRDFGKSCPSLSFAEGTQHDAAEMTALRDVARRLGIARSAVTGLPAEFEDITKTEWSNAWQQELLASANAMLPRIDEIETAREAMASATGLQLSLESQEELRGALSLGHAILECRGHDMRFAIGPDFTERAADGRSAAALVTDYRAGEQALSARYAPEAARRIDVAAMQAAWHQAGARFWFLASLAKRRVARELAGVGGAAGPVDPGVDLPLLAELKEGLERLDRVAGAASAVPGWAALATDTTAVEANIVRAERLRISIAALASGPEVLIALRASVASLVIDANDMLAPDGQIAGAIHRLAAALEEFENEAGRFKALAEIVKTSGFRVLRSQAEAVRDNASRLNAWANWRRIRDEAGALWLAPLASGLEDGSVEPERTCEALETGYAHWFASSRIDAEPLLRHFIVGEQQDRIARFREVDERMSGLASRYIRAKLCGLIPDKSELQGRDGYGVLKHQLQLQRPSKAVRQLAAEMGDAFTRLAPCMLMSPLSIAQYLPTDQALFDLIIFDEASQITPWDAIGAMARGKQVIIAGDPRQMPPSNDFQRGVGSVTSEDDVEPDLDSILDECLAAGVPQHSLEWHYRSRHESLITFSNHNYYDGKLVTFPAPVTRSSAVTWKRVDGVWARGAEKTNAIEAKAIVDEAVERLRDPAFIDPQGKPLTLAIITMNTEQMRLIEDLLDKARRSYPEIEPHFDSEQRLEPVVVRNLETAQGDERDVVLIGMSFGPTEPGGRTMSMNFGKLNAQGGWRRLNVAITRARQEMKVFTSFDPGMIDLTRTSQRAIADLKHFIEFADRGPRAIAEADRGSLGGADSPFEEAVAWELQRRGWNVVPQVGVSRFRIDLGVVHPDRPGDYLLGVECDGATYHSAATARDRDRVRASILESLGWNLARVWSTDWWIDRERAAERLHMALVARLEADRAEFADRDLKPVQAERTASVVGVSPISAEDSALSEKIWPTKNEIQQTEDSEPREPLVASNAALAPYRPHAGEAAPAEYRQTRFGNLAETIDPSAFYDPVYDPRLTALILRVLETEAPISETLLVQRIARAHGFQRAGRLIRDRVMTLAGGRHHVSGEGKDQFVWLDDEQQRSWNSARGPASEDDVRQIEEIALEELHAAARFGDPAAMARHFGVRRLSSHARDRILSILR
jgi:very-short-patch-repair endonuclease